MVTTRVILAKLLLRLLLSQLLSQQTHPHQSQLLSPPRHQPTPQLQHQGHPGLRRAAPLRATGEPRRTEGPSAWHHRRRLLCAAALRMASSASPRTRRANAFRRRAQAARPSSCALQQGKGCAPGRSWRARCVVEQAACMTMRLCTPQKHALQLLSQLPS